MKRRLAVSVLTTSLALSPLAPAAEPSPTDPSATAEDLFRRAMKLMTESRAAEACPLLAESFRLDPGGGTLQNLAICYETVERWASAYARFEELRVMSKNANPPRHDRVKLAEEHLERVKPRVARIVLVVPSGGSSGMEARVDGVVYRQASWSTGIAVDPGAHQIVVEAPGKVAWQKAVVTAANEGGEQRIDVPVLADAPSSAPVAESRSDGVAPPGARDRETRDRTLRTTGFVVGGAGLAVLAAGAAFGVLTIVKNEDGKAQCRADGGSGAAPTDFAPNGRCFEGSAAWRQANDTKDTAETFANVSNVLVPLGAVATVVGAWIVLSHPKPSTARNAQAPRVRLAPTFGGAVMQGRF